MTCLFLFRIFIAASLFGWQTEPANCPCLSRFCHAHVHYEESAEARKKSVPKKNSRQRKQEMKRNWWKRKQRKFNLLLPNSVCHFEYLSDRDCAMVQAYYRLNLYSGKRARNEKKKKITRKNERNRRYYLFGIFRRWFHNRLSEEIS